MLKNSKWSVALILIVCLSCYDCKGYRSGGSRRTSARRVATSSPKRYSQQSYAKPTPSYTHVQYATARPVQATPRQAVRATTPKYNIRTQPTVRYQPQPQPNYNQPGYNQPGYHQPGYNQPGYNQPGYHQPGYNQPGHIQPNYNQPGRIQPNYNQPSYNQPHYQSGYQPAYGGYYPGKSNHGVRNAVFAGLGGSALGLYLGYKMGSWSNDNNHSPYGANYGANSGPNSGNVGDVPRYSVVHHYYHGEKPIPQNVQVENKTLATCANDTNFCTPNTSPLCMANGTIYCISPIDKTSPCDVNSTMLTCINSTITVPCVNDTNTICNTTTVNTTISIPCVTNVTVFGNFADNKLTVQKISDVSENATTITSEGISNKFCVTVIAEPVPKPINMTNAEFMKYIDENPEIKEEEDVKESAGEDEEEAGEESAPRKKFGGADTVIEIPKSDGPLAMCLLEKPMVDKKVKRHSIHGMMEEENVIRPHQEIAQLSLEEKKFLLAVERGDVASTRRMLQRAEETAYININCVDPLGRSALLMAIDNENLEMVELLIEHRVETKDALLHAISEEFVEAVEVLLDHEETLHKPGEPHSWEALPPDTATFTPDITPLILSAHRDNYEIIKILLDRGATLPMPHDVRCGCDECVTSRMEDSLRHSRSRINAYRALASPSLIALSSKDPILTAFELSWELRRLSFMEHEFKLEYQELRKQCQDFATALLDHTRSSYELEVLLNHDPTGPAFEHGERMHLNRLKLAIKLRQKKLIR